MKTRRQKMIQELITREAIHTQEELALKLQENGFDVTQATISRDIKELGLLKIPTAGDEYRYSLQSDSRPVGSLEKLKRMFQDAVVSFDDSENIIVIKTIPGNAQALAHLFDNLGWKEIIGTVAGDDTIFLLIKPKDQVETLLLKLRELV